ncbi:MAG: hypothetical protein IPJ69_12725 [Deltaproteobacteria bacterium]|nr:MAG: hypothetical protein IPJ69_12725 [Deltaproteobacteria bacterium]
MSNIVSCTVPTSSEAEIIVSKLKTANFSNSDISVLFAEAREGDKANVNITNQKLEKNSKAPEGAAAGGGTGAVIGSVLGWLVGIGSLAIPGIGPFIAAGPIMAALSGGAVGAALGGVVGSLVGLGIPEMEAKQYEIKLKQGHTLISVHTQNEEQVKTARDIFKECSAHDISEVKPLAA